MSSNLWIMLGLPLAACAGLYYIFVLRKRGRDMRREIAQSRARDLQRARYCEAFGHHLDECCLCTRCLAAQHDYAVTGSKEYFLRSELINPAADPGALYLDSNFQPDSDYGLEQNVYQTVKTSRCTRCAHEMVTREEHKVDDER